LTGVEHRLVLGNGGDDVVALLAVHLGHTLDGEVVALGGAGGEDDLFCSRADQLRNLLTSLLHGCLGAPPKRMVPAGSVAEFLHEVGQHGLEHTRIHGGGGMVVHVDGQLDAVGSWSALLLGRGLQIGGTHVAFSYLVLESWFSKTGLQLRVTSSASVFLASLPVVSPDSVISAILMFLS